MKTTVLNIDQFKKPRLVNDLYVNSFSNHIKLNETLISKPHSHNFYVCVLFTEGTGVHEIDFNSYAIHPGSMFFLKPGQTHFWKFESQPKGFILFHAQEVYEMHFLNHRLNSFPFYYSYHNPPMIVLPPKESNAISGTFQELYEEYLGTKLYREMKIVNRINSIYIEVSRAYTTDTDVSKSFHSNYIKMLEKLEKLIDQHYDKQKFPKFYATQLNMTTKHLNRVVKETINKTTGQLISERILLEAKRLIVHADDSLSNIANMLGFSDYAYFSKVFKSKTGVTPLTFKTTYLKK